MHTFFCRVLAFTFLVNCCVPSAGWGQTTSRSNARSLDTRVNQQVQKAQEDNSPAALFAKADAAARQAHQERFAQADSLAAQQRNQAALNPSYTAVASSTYVAPRVAPLQRKLLSPAKTFLRKVENNEISFEELIEYADPMDPAIENNDLTTIAYAAEIIGNTVSEAIQLDASQYDSSELQKVLPQIEARLLWRMALLGFEAPSYTANTAKTPVSLSRAALQPTYGSNSIEHAMAMGTLRMTLFKIHQFYQTKGLEDPADAYQTEMLSRQMMASQRPNLLVSLEGDRRTLRAPQQTESQKRQAQATAKRKAAQTVAEHGNLAAFMNLFMSELRQAKNDKPDQGSYEYRYLQALAEYATAYALEYKPEVVKDIVSIFDEGVKHDLHGKVKAGDFNRDYSPILNAIFTTVFENTRYAAMSEAKTQKVLSLLTDFSDPEKYSLPTRIFALEAAGLLFRPFNQDSFNTQNTQPAFAVFAPLNLNKPDENLRRLFAARVAELYCPLTNQSTYGMQSYGLDSQQMQALADKLAYIYDGFYDIHTAFFEDADKPASTQARANYPSTQCHITLKNEPNRTKKNDEYRTAFFVFTAEAIFWVYGGELFAFVGTAFRLTRGAVAALPKAGRAFRVAANGERVAAFNAEIRQGAKFANWVYKNKNQQGYFVELLVEKEPQAVKGVSAARTTEVGPVRSVSPTIEARPVNHTYQLQGQYSHWNPKRWVGMQPQQNIVGMRVTRLEPGFKTTVAETTFEQPVSGFHSMRDIEQAWSQLRLVNDPASAMVYETKPYWQAILDLRQAQTEQMLLGGLESSLKNQVDLWVPMGESAQQAGTVGATTKWWNMRWGMHPQGMSPIVSGKMPFYVAPRTALNFTRSSSSRIMDPEGIANVPELLPGFYTTGADVMTGNLRRQMFDAYFRPMNWQNTISKTFLPDYVPSATFWNSVRANPALGVQLLPQMLWRNRFSISTGVLGAWYGADYVVSSPFLGWMQNEALKDANAEIAKYGDTFDPQRAKMDELLLQDLGVDLSDQRAMGTYEAVMQAQKPQNEGMLITAPIVSASRIAGRSFLDDATKVDYAYQAHRVDLNRALLTQRHNQFTENKKATAQWQQEQRALIESSEQQLLAMYAKGFAALPQVKKDLHRAYQTYAQEFLACATQEEATQAGERFNQNTETLILQAAIWDGALKEAESLIAQFKADYSAMPDIVSPAVQQRIRQAARTYATQRCEALQVTNQQAQAAQVAQAEQQFQGILYQIAIELQFQYQNIGYGASFDPNAGQEE
ncbi:MAG: hypothetical protein IJ876_01470 [Elusimicrobiaceae bacterium]|nr:hypothetical protein [Elusimicrobiaceae bacterium]